MLVSILVFAFAFSFTDILRDNGLSVESVSLSCTNDGFSASRADILEISGNGGGMDNNDDDGCIT